MQEFLKVLSDWLKCWSSSYWPQKLWETWGLEGLEVHGCNLGHFSADFRSVPATKNCVIIQINPVRSCLGRGKIERRGSSLDAAAQKTRRSRTPKSTHSDLTCWDWPDPLQPNFHRVYAYILRKLGWSGIYAYIWYMYLHMHIRYLHIYDLCTCDFSFLIQYRICYCDVSTWPDFVITFMLNWSRSCLFYSFWGEVCFQKMDAGVRESESDSGFTTSDPSFAALQ